MTLKVGSCLCVRRCDFHVVARREGATAGAHPQCGQVGRVVSWFGVGTGSRGSGEGRFPERYNVVADEERIDTFVDEVIESRKVSDGNSLKESFKFAGSTWVIDKVDKILRESASRCTWPWLRVVKSLHVCFVGGSIGNRGVSGGSIGGGKGGVGSRSGGGGGIGSIGYFVIEHGNIVVFEVLIGG